MNETTHCFYYAHHCFHLQNIFIFAALNTSLVCSFLLYLFNSYRIAALIKYLNCLYLTAGCWLFFNALNFFLITVYFVDHLWFT